MADTSQQAKEWSRCAVPPQRDVGAALAALSEELRARSLPHGTVWSDLLHEAVLRALTGRGPGRRACRCSPFRRASCAASATSNGAVTADRIIYQSRTVVAGLTTPSGPALQRRCSPPYNGCSRPTRQP